MALPIMSDTLAHKKGAARRKSIMFIESFPVYKKKESLPSTSPKQETIPLFNERLLAEGTPNNSKLTDQEQLLNSVRRFDRYLMNRQNASEASTTKNFNAPMEKFRSTITHFGSNSVLYDYLKSTKHGQGIRIIRDNMQLAPESIELCRLSASVILHTLNCLENVSTEESRSKVARCNDEQIRRQEHEGEDDTQDARIRRLTMLSSTKNNTSSFSHNHKSRSLTRLSALRQESSAVCVGETRSNLPFLLPSLPTASEAASIKGGATASAWTAELIKMNLLKSSLIALYNSSGEQCVQALYISILRKFLKLCPGASVPILIKQPLTLRGRSWHPPLSFCCGLAIVLRCMQMHENSFYIQGECAALILALSSIGHHDVSGRICQLEWPSQFYISTNFASKGHRYRGSVLNTMIRLIRRWKQVTENGVQTPHQYLSTFEQQKCLLAHKAVTQALAQLVTDNLLEIRPKDLAYIKRATRLHKLNFGA